MLTVNTPQFVRLKSTEGSVLKSRRWRCWCVPRHSYMSWAEEVRSRGDRHLSELWIKYEVWHCWIICPLFCCHLFLYFVSLVDEHNIVATTYVLTWTTWQTVTSRVSTGCSLSTRCILGAGTSFDTAAEIEETIRCTYQARKSTARFPNVLKDHIQNMCFVVKCATTSASPWQQHFIQLKLSAVYYMKVFRCDDLELQDFMRESWYE